MQASMLRQPFASPPQTKGGMNNLNGKGVNIQELNTLEGEIGETETLGTFGEAVLDGSTLEATNGGVNSAVSVDKIEALDIKKDIKSHEKKPFNIYSTRNAAFLGFLLLLGTAVIAAATTKSIQQWRNRLDVSNKPMELSSKRLYELGRSVHENFINLEEQWIISSEETRKGFKLWYCPRKKGIVVIQDPIGLTREYIKTFNTLSVPSDSEDYTTRRAYAIQCFILNAILEASLVRLKQLQHSYQQWMNDPTYTITTLELSGPFVNTAELRKTPGAVSYNDFTTWLSYAGVEGFETTSSTSLSNQDNNNNKDLIPLSLASRLKNQILLEIFNSKEDNKVLSIFTNLFHNIQQTLYTHDSPYLKQNQTTELIDDPLKDIYLLSNTSFFPIFMFKQACEEAEDTFEKPLSIQIIKTWEKVWDVGTIVQQLRSLDDRSIKRQVQAQKLMQTFVERATKTGEEDAASSGLFAMALALL